MHSLRIPLSIAWSVCALVYLGTGNRAYGQAQLADELIVISKGLRAQENARTNSHLGPAPGARENRLGDSPGAGKAQLSERPPGLSVARRDVLSAAAAPAGGQAFGRGAEPVITPAPHITAAPLPQFGPLEIPTQEDEGPTDGMTLDMAIDRLSRENFGLRTKFQEIPKAQADILSAGLRGNPLVFATVDNVPYGSYSPQRPGENGYGVTIIQPIDANHKRTVRILAAQQAKRALDAQYQDAVRLEIDNLYTTFVDVLAARETVRYSEASVKGLNNVLEVAEKQLKGQQRSVIELDRLRVQRDASLIALDEAQAALAKALQVLAVQVNLPAVEAESLSIRGALLTAEPDIPPVDELVALARVNRPDLVAYRLGVQRAQADVSLARKEAYPDVFVLYTPYSLRNNTPTGGQDASSWSLGAMASIPLFNRNQGNIRRAEINVTQTSTEMSGIDRQIEAEVRNALKDYATAAVSVQRLERDILPRSRDMRERTFNLFQIGEESAIGYLNAQREYSEIVRQYRDALIRQRRAALRINTAVALRIVP